MACALCSARAALLENAVFSAVAELRWASTGSYQSLHSLAAMSMLKQSMRSFCRPVRKGTISAQVGLEEQLVKELVAREAKKRSP